MSATVHYTLDDQNRVVYLSKGDNLGALPTLAAVLQTYSNAAIFRLSATQTAVYSGTESSGEVATTDLEAYISFRDATDKKGAIILPAPKDSIFQYISNRGYRVKSVEGQAIVAAYSVFCGEALTFVDGWLRGNQP